MAGKCHLRPRSASWARSGADATRSGGSGEAQLDLCTAGHPPAGDASQCVPHLGQPTEGQDAGGQEQSEEVRGTIRSESLSWDQEGCGFQLAGKLQTTAKVLLQPRLSLITSKLAVLREKPGGNRLWGKAPGKFPSLDSGKPRHWGKAGGCQPIPKAPSPTGESCSVGPSPFLLPKRQRNKRGGGGGEGFQRNFFQLLGREKPYSSRKNTRWSWSLSNPQQCGTT